MSWKYIWIYWLGGEDQLSHDSPNPPTTNITPKTETPSLPPIKSPENILRRPVCDGRKNVNYRKMDNPRAQPSNCMPTQTEPLNVSRPTVASAARHRQKEMAHIAFQSVFDALTWQDPSDPEWLPQTRKEALECEEGREWEKAIDTEYTQLIERGTW